MPGDGPSRRARGSLVVSGRQDPDRGREAAGRQSPARALESQRYQVEPTDPATIAGTMASLLALSVAAAAGPVWRASRIDPTATLRAL